MKQFGFSAFLKLVSLNEGPQRSALRRQFGPSRGDYDFHKRFRQHARRYLLDGEPIEDVLASAAAMTPVPERRSAVSALERLMTWRCATPGEILHFPPVVFESPRSLFKVKFEPDFGLRIAGKPTAIHLWNTAKPKLALGPTYAALTLAAQSYEAYRDGPTDIGVLSMRDPPSFYPLSAAPDHSAAAIAMLEHVEETILETTLPPPPAEEHPFPLAEISLPPRAALR